MPPGGGGSPARSDDNGNRSRSLFRGENGRPTGRHNDIDLGLNRLSAEPREPIVLTSPPAAFYHAIPPLDIVQTTQALAKPAHHPTLDPAPPLTKHTHSPPL